VKASSVIVHRLVYCCLLKQVRTELIETAPIMEAMVQEVTGVKVSSMHHDITVTGEEMVLFTLAKAPAVR
jgi:uncharacterized protein YbcI